MACCNAICALTSPVDSAWTCACNAALRFVTYALLCSVSSVVVVVVVVVKSLVRGKEEEEEDDDEGKEKILNVPGGAWCGAEP